MAKNDRGSAAALAAQAKKLEADLGRFSSEFHATLTGPGFEPIEALPLAKNITERLRCAFEACSDLAEELCTSLTGKHEHFLDSYPARLGEALRAAGYEPIGDPTRPIVEGIAFIEVDTSKPEVLINDQPVGALLPQAVVEELRETLQRIRSRCVPPAVFLSELEHAYIDEVKANGREAGSQVHLRSVHLRLLINRQTKSFRSDPRAGLFKDYPVEVFRADLYSALLSGLRLPSGNAVQIVSGADTQGSIFMVLPSIGRPSYAGRICLERRDL